MAKAKSGKTTKGAAATRGRKRKGTASAGAKAVRTAAKTGKASRRRKAATSAKKATGRSGNKTGRGSAAVKKTKATATARRQKKAVGARSAVKKAAVRRVAGASKNVNSDARRKAAPANPSVGGARAAHRTAAPAVTNPVRAPARPRMPKTTLSAKELREFKALLLHKRAQLETDVEQLTEEALRRERHGGESTHMPIHMADVGSDNWEQDFTIGLIANERSLVREIDAALMRIKNKTYGVCLATHKPISLARLRAKPWAKYCIEYARAREEGRTL